MGTLVSSKTSSGEIRKEVADSYEENIQWLRNRGFYFGLDSTGLAYVVVTADDIRVAGPDGCGETCAFYARQAIERGRQK